MTKSEAAQLVGTIGTAYPNWRLHTLSKRDQEAAIEVWAAILEPTDASAAVAVTIDLLRSDREFAPSPGTIFTRAAELAWKREKERSKAEALKIATAIVKTTPRLEGGSLVYEGMYRELDRRHPELVMPHDDLGRPRAETYAEIKANSRRDELQGVIFEVAQALQHQLRLPPPPPSKAGMFIDAFVESFPMDGSTEGLSRKTKAAVDLLNRDETKRLDRAARLAQIREQVGLVELNGNGKVDDD